MSKGHFSPVTVRIKVIKEEPKVRKFVYSLSSPFGIISAKRYTPKIANIILIRVRSAPILNMAGKLTMNVIIVFFRALFLLKKKKMRTILKDLMTVV